jgi:hypothetical protein
MAKTTDKAKLSGCPRGLALLSGFFALALHAGLLKELPMAHFS